MAQSAPRVSKKKIEGAVEWIEPKELNRFLNVLQQRVVELEAQNSALAARVAALEAQ
jgi:hypothetical protein